ncbi:hypothetical protein QOT17_013621 [Balamuthia mandrillaris]
MHLAASTSRWALVVLFCLAAAAGLWPCVRSQTCEPWDGIPAYCTQFDGWQAPNIHVYVPTNWTLASLEEKVVRAVNIAGALGNDNSIPSRCNRLWARLNCATYLRPCATALDDNGEESVLTTPRQPCKSGCFTYEDICAEYVASLNLPLGVSLYYPPGYAQPMTCAEIDTNGQDFYQEENYNVTLPNNQTYNLQCNSLLTNTTTYIICEEPLYTVEGSNECGFTCPLPSYGEKKYDTLKVLQLVLGWLSWLGSLIVILSYSLHNKLRKFPSNLILMAAVAAHAESVGMILPTFFGYDNTWCGWDTNHIVPDSSIQNGKLTLEFTIEDLSMHSGLCTFQGWLVQMGFLSSTMWWGIVAFNMFLSVFFGKKLPNTKRWNTGLQIAFHVCGWAVPVVLMLIPAAADEISFYPGGTFCHLGSANAFFLTFWAIPVGLILLVGTILFSASLCRMLQFARQLKELKKTCGTYFRVILFILIYLVLIIFIFAYSLHVVDTKESIEEGYADYYECLLKRENNCSLSEEVHNYPLAVLRSISYSSLGLMLFLNFCISPSMGRFWIRFLQHVREGRFSSMFTSDKTPTGKSPGTGKKTKSLATKEMITMSVDDGSGEIIP